MTLWTIQSIDAWKELQTSGILRCYDRFVENEDYEAYKWMAKQMEKRIPVPRPGNAMPLWAWFQWEGEQQKRPDLRSSSHLPRGDRGVRIEFQIRDDWIILSDFDLWHYVLNYWYLPQSLADEELFEMKLAEHGLSFYDTKPLPDPIFHDAIRQSWERIFDIEWEEKGITVPKEQKSIQATFWELRLKDLRLVDEFVAR